MYSVDDLLISHGYKPSKTPTNSSEVAGDQHKDTGRQSGPATRNGAPIHPGAIPKTNKARGYKNSDKNKLAVQGIPRNTHHDYFSGPGNVEEELYDQSLSRSSLSKKDKEFSAWRRQCHDFSACGYFNRVDNDMKGMRAACALYDDDKAPWATEGGSANRWSNRQEAMKPCVDYRRQSLKTDTWKKPAMFGQREPDTDDKKRPLQDVYSGRENIAASHVQNKPQFLSSQYAEIPAESLKYSEPATRPKYGRPLKPPPYEFHSNIRALNPPQDEKQKRKTIFYVTKVDESDQDSTLGPPMYVPPPSYKSGKQSKNHVPKVPDYNECFIKEMQVVDQGSCISPGSSVKQLQMEDEEPILTSEPLVRCQEKQQSSVQYIPFDDPRIRHIKVIHPADRHQMDDQAEDANNSSVFHKNSVDQEFSNLNDIADSINPAVKCSPVSGRSIWFVEPNAYLDSDALSTQRGSYDTGKNPDCSKKTTHKRRPSAQRPDATELSSEIFTKVKTFESGTEIQGKNHLKKKPDGIMFCLVSRPPQSELNMAGFDLNNNIIQGSIEMSENDSNRDLKEQSFLSMSSTDLELQALTGNMLNKNVLEKQDFQRPEFKQMNYFSCKQPPKYKELEYSGSSPCTKYKDQETQTNFREEPQIQQPLQGPQQPVHGLQPRKSNTLTNGHFLKYGSSTTESSPSRTPISNSKDRPIPPPRKTQFNKPSKPESPKTKKSQNELHTTSTGLPGQKNEPSFAHKEERKSPCSVKEAFGQFLLKPVSRRPWDAISELESFNKEIQTVEERNEDENHQKEKTEEDKKVENAEGKASKADEVTQDHGCGTEVKKLISVFKNGTNKSKPESENTSKISDTGVVLGDLRNVRLEARRRDKPLKEKKGNDLNERQDNARKIIKEGIRLHPVKSNVSGCQDSGNSKPLNPINSKQASVKNNKDKDSNKIKKRASKNTPASKTASVAPLSFKRRNQGRSEPKLRSVGLDVNEESSIPGSSTRKISSNESLHTRASRILGIEVAVESLTADNKTFPDEGCGSNKMAQSREFSNKKKLRAETETDVASSKGKPKRGWSKSTLIGENSSGSVKDQCSGEEKLAREQYFLGKHQEAHAPSPESAGLSLAERKSLPSKVGKKTKNTSKITILGQGKVASAVSRAAMDRIARMREVDSVSRMRRLAIKNGEDRDEDQQFKESEGRGNDSAVGSTELPCKLSQGSCISKRVISLDEKECLGNKNTKKKGKDLPSSEVCDPSQVDRV